MGTRLSLMILVSLSVPLPIVAAAQLETVVENVVRQHMLEKQIPGMSVAIVQDGTVVFAGAYGKASVEFDVPARQCQRFLPGCSPCVSSRTAS
jgi:CubicO group peptidase (beta-lactamase class C family)